MGLGIVHKTTIKPQKQANSPATGFDAEEVPKVREYCVDQLELPWGLGAYDQRQVLNYVNQMLKGEPIGRALPGTESHIKIATQIVEQLKKAQ